MHGVGGKRPQPLISEADPGLGSEGGVNIQRGGECGTPTLQKYFLENSIFPLGGGQVNHQTASGGEGRVNPTLNRNLYLQRIWGAALFFFGWGRAAGIPRPWIRQNPVSSSAH